MAHESRDFLSALKKNKAEHTLAALVSLVGITACQTTPLSEQNNAPSRALYDHSDYSKLTTAEKPEKRTPYKAPDRALYDHADYYELKAAEKPERRIPYESIPEYLKREGRQDALREYWRGVYELQRSAREDSYEKMAAFVIRQDGAFEWVETELVEIMVSNDKGSSKKEFVYGILKSFIIDMASRVENGNRVIIFHTHPSQFLKDVQNDKPDTLRVPPSPTDIYTAFRFMRELHPDAFERVNFSIVAENSLWGYGFKTQEALDRFSVALGVGFARLEQEDSEEIKNKALILENALTDALAKVEADKTALVAWPVITILKSDHLLTEIEENPRLLVDLHLVQSTFDSLGVPVPEDARKLLDLFNEIHSEVQKEFLGSDPTTDGGFSDSPFLGNFPAYTKRWEGIGAVMEEVPLLPAKNF